MSFHFLILFFSDPVIINETLKKWFEILDNDIFREDLDLFVAGI